MWHHRWTQAKGLKLKDDNNNSYADSSASNPDSGFMYARSDHMPLAPVAVAIFVAPVILMWKIVRVCSLCSLCSLGRFWQVLQFLQVFVFFFQFFSVLASFCKLYSLRSFSSFCFIFYSFSAGVPATGAQKNLARQSQFGVGGASPSED